jgi:hypothetical protein
MLDLAHAIVEQAVMGRTVTIRRVNVLADAKVVADGPQMIEMTLANAKNEYETSLFPTHGKDGTQLGNDDFVALLNLNSDKLTEREAVNSADS